LELRTETKIMWLAQKGPEYQGDALDGLPADTCRSQARLDLAVLVVYITHVNGFRWLLG